MFLHVNGSILKNMYPVICDDVLEQVGLKIESLGTLANEREAVGLLRPFLTPSFNTAVRLSHPGAPSLALTSARTDAVFMPNRMLPAVNVRTAF